MKKDIIKIRVCDKTVLEYNPIARFVPRRAPSVALLYPAPYSVAAQSLGYQLLYALLVSQGLRVERFTYDSCGRSLESGTPLKKFDFVVVSSSFELDYPYLAEYLRAYKSDDQRVLAGGIAPTSNPVPLLDEVDFVALGDAEPLIDRLAEALFSEDFEALSSLPNVVTADKLEGEKAVADISESPLLAKQFVPLSVEPPWGRGFLVEVTRGCLWRCRFCLEGWVSKPFRERKLKQLKAALKDLSEPFEKVITISLSLGDYSELKGYLDELVRLRKRGIVGSVPSMRLDSLTAEIVEKIKRMGQKTVTLAPETLLPEKAEVLGKGFNPDVLKEKLTIIKRYGLNVKLYMMVLPREPPDVTENEINVLKRVLKETKVKFHISVNPLIPKPWTPLQGAPAPGKEEERALEAFKPLGHVDTYPVHWARLQAAIGLSVKPIMKLLDPSLPPKKQTQKLIEAGAVKGLDSWRLNWDEPWLKLKVGNLEEIKELGERSYEAWRRLVERRVLA